MKCGKELSEKELWDNLCVHIITFVQVGGLPMGGVTFY